MKARIQQIQAKQKNVKQMEEKDPSLGTIDGIELFSDDPAYRDDPVSLTKELMQKIMKIANRSITKVKIDSVFCGAPSANDLVLLEWISIAMRANGGIKSLDISRNDELFIKPDEGVDGYAGGQQIVESPLIQALKANPKLEQLNLSLVGLSDYTIPGVIGSLKTLLNLTFLDVSFNDFTQIGYRALEDYILNSSLKEVNIANIDNREVVGEDFVYGDFRTDFVKQLADKKPEITFTIADKAMKNEYLGEYPEREESYNSFIDDLSEERYLKYSKGMTSLLNKQLFPPKLSLRAMDDIREMILEYIPDDLENSVKIMGLEKAEYLAEPLS